MELLTLPSTDHERVASPPRLPAARTVNAVKVYGKGDTAVRALDGVSVDFAAGGFTAIMGPSGSGKSTLLHALAGLDDLTSGHVFIGDTDLTRLRRQGADDAAPGPHRLRLPGLQPGADAHRLSRTSRCRCALAHRRPDKQWLRQVVDTVGLGNRLSTARASCRAASSSGSPWPGRWPASPRSSSPTSRPGTSTAAAAPRSSRSCAGPCGSSARPIVMVTHDPVAASYSDRVVLLADGRIVDEIVAPTPDAVLDRMKQIGR